MTSQTHNDILQTSHSNIIKIPYSDNQEESIVETSFQVNGFTVVELNDGKNDFYNLIPLYEEEQNIDYKQQIHLKSKAKTVENYYSNSEDDEIVPGVNCSRCLLGNFISNELLYFKDRKTFIAYLKYCFIYLKKKIFMNHSIYMNNYYDLFKINQSFYNGWKFSFEKTLCKSCFIQLINMEYLLSNLKNIICDYDEIPISTPQVQKQVSNFLNNKRKRIISKNKRKKPIIKKENKNIEEKIDDNNSQISPIVIPISENEKIKKKRTNSNNAFKKRKLKNLKKRKKSIFNKNVSYDKKNNALIINKKNLGKYQPDEDLLIIKSIIDNKKSSSNKEKEEKEKKKEKENSKTIKKNGEKLKFVSTIKSESDSSNRKTTQKDKQSENSIKDINGNKNKNYLNKNNFSKNIDSKNTIIINNINSNKDSINMNRVGLIQINNNQFENNNFNNYSNKDYNIKNNLKQNNNNVLFNNLNNNYNYNNNNYFDYSNPSSTINFNLNEAGFPEDIRILCIFLMNLNKFTSTLLNNIKNGSIDYIFKYKQFIINNFNYSIELVKRFNFWTSLLDYKINSIRYYIDNYQKYNTENKSYFNDLMNRINILDKNENEIKTKYRNIFELIIKLCYALNQIVDNIIPI